MAFWSSVPSISKEANCRFQLSEASWARVSKSLFMASAWRFFKAPSVLVAERATFTTSSGFSALSNSK